MSVFFLMFILIYIMVLLRSFVAFEPLGVMCLSILSHLPVSSADSSVRQKKEKPSADVRCRVQTFEASRQSTSNHSPTGEKAAVEAWLPIPSPQHRPHDRSRVIWQGFCKDSSREYLEKTFSDDRAQTLSLAKIRKKYDISATHLHSFANAGDGLLRKKKWQ
ncbi:MAG: hypothetical protein PUK16_07825 [Prevotellaceae bacterium]|nr:hypothetical protein [Prevotellaceae bacterium]